MAYRNVRTRNVKRGFEVGEVLPDGRQDPYKCCNVLAVVLCWECGKFGPSAARTGNIAFVAEKPQ